MEEAADPIEIRLGEEGRLIVRLPYTPERVAKIKTISGRRWNNPEKYWTVPHEDGMPGRLLALFAGERVELAPALRCAGAAPASPPYPQDQLRDRIHETIRTRHMSPRTEETDTPGLLLRPFLATIFSLAQNP